MPEFIDIEGCLLDLAASKIEIDESVALNFKDFKRKIIGEYKEWLNALKLKAMHANIPLRAELMDMIYEDSSSLGSSAEMESLGLNDTRIHPDIYMNELLVGMRTIHQILPYIMKKLGIYDEFKLNLSDLSNSNKK